MEEAENYNRSPDRQTNGDRPARQSVARDVIVSINEFHGLEVAVANLQDEQHSAGEVHLALRNFHPAQSAHVELQGKLRAVQPCLFRPVDILGGDGEDVLRIGGA